MPALSAPDLSTTEMPPTLRSIARWVRATYQAPFQNTSSAQSVKELERFRRSALLRVIIFTITLISACVLLPAALLAPHEDAATPALLVIILSGLLSLWWNERGWLALASAAYFYTFLLACYLYIILAPSGLNLQAIAVYGIINTILFLGGLTFSQRAVWPHCALVILVSSALLLLTPLRQTPSQAAKTALPDLIVYIDASYLLTTFLCRLAGRSGRVGMIKLATTLEQEQQLVALKDLFIVSANHELRTPIMTLSANLELLSRTLERVGPQERQEMLERALRASRDLKDMLRNVLDVGMSEAEVRRQLQVETLSVRTLVQQAMDTFDPRELGEPWLEKTTLKSRAISLDIAPDLFILADSQRTRQVLINLLSNALKYSDAAAPIAISARRIESTEEHAAGKPTIPAGSWVQISVRDQGLGIPPREQPLLFTRFVRLSRDAASSTRGTGVGLYICRTLIQAMGGQIWVESTGIPGEGSVFSFILRAARSDPA